MAGVADPGDPGEGPGRTTRPAPDGSEVHVRAQEPQPCHPVSTLVVRECCDFGSPGFFSIVVGSFCGIVLLSLEPMVARLRSVANPGLHGRWSLLLTSSMLQAEDSDGATSVQEFMLMAQKASWSFWIPICDLVVEHGSSDPSSESVTTRRRQQWWKRPIRSPPRSSRVARQTSGPLAKVDARRLGPCSCQDV